MSKKKFNYFCYFILGILIYQFLNKLTWWQPDFSSDYDTHWGYLAATTFDFIDPKWDFPQWVNGPWYYMLYSYTIGPIFFFLFYLGKITVHEAAMYTFLSGNFFLSLILFYAVIKLSKILFSKVLARFAYVAIVMFLPFTYKSFFNYGVENFAMALTPLVIYYLIQSYKKNKLNHWIKLSIVFSLVCVSKISFLIPLFCLLVGSIILCFIKKKSVNKKYFLQFVSTLFLLYFSFLITGSSLLNNNDIRNVERGYGDVPSMSVFYTVDFLDAYKNPNRYEQNYSMINSWSLDFFGDYYGNFKTDRKYGSFDKTTILNRNSLYISIFFFIWYLILVIKNYKVEKFISFKSLLTLFFFLIFVEAISYCFFVFMAEKAQSLNLRYWGFYVFFLAFPIANYFNNLKVRFYEKINLVILLLVVTSSFVQMYIIL